MADATVTVSTPLGDIEVSVDEILGIIHERVKLQIGPTGEAADVSADNPVPVIDTILQAAVATLQPVSAIIPGRKDSTTPGVAVPLVNSPTPCKWVIVSALAANVGVVMVSGAGVLATSGSETGTPLYQYGSVVLPVDDAAEVHIDVVDSGDAVAYSIGS